MVLFPPLFSSPAVGNFGPGRDTKSSTGSRDSPGWFAESSLAFAMFNLRCVKRVVASLASLFTKPSTQIPCRSSLKAHCGLVRCAFAPLVAWLAIQNASAVEIDFNHQIVPILRERCGECHTGDSQQGGFSMNDRAALLTGSETGAVVNMDEPSASRLIEVIKSEDEGERMPPEGDRLTAKQVALIEQWIEEGLPWEPGFAFKAPAYEPPLRPRTVTLPPITKAPHASGVDQERTNPVDRLVDAYLSTNGIEIPKAVDDHTFLRRAYLDLIGLLPTPEEIREFQSDSQADKRERLITRLLARDVDYAEHWLTFWNDLLRNDYGGTGFITGGRKQISKWLYESLVNNKPFDQMARELIAPPSDESSGFIDGIKWRGEVSAGQTVEIQFAQSVGQSFLGINLKCASCHDSFVDRWKLDEAYGLAAIYADKPLEIHRCDKPVGRTANASWLFPELGQVDAAAPRDQRLKQLAALMTHPENGRFSRTIVNRLWHRMMGRGIVHPLDAMQSEPWNEDLLDFLASDFQANGYDLRRTLALIASSQAYQAKSEVVNEATGEFVFKGPRARRLTAEQFVDAVWQLTGTAPRKMDAVVFRGKVDPAAGKQIQMTGNWIWGSSAAEGKTPPSGESILLRTTLTLDEEPTGGAAIMTCDNEFILHVNGKKIGEANDWQQVTVLSFYDALKKGDNDIVVRATNAGSGPNAAGFYFQANVQFKDGKEISLVSDKDWTFLPTAESVKAGIAKMPELWLPVTVLNALPVWTNELNKQGPGLLHSGVATGSLMVRASLLKSDFLMRSLGRPNRDQIVSMRPEEFTTLEALDLSNGETLSNAIERGAEHLVQQDWASSRELVEWLFKHALTREPTKNQLDAASDLIGDKPTSQAVADLLWVVIMQPEFHFVR